MVSASGKQNRGGARHPKLLPYGIIFESLFNGVVHAPWEKGDKEDRPGR
jgi:hypothetical protein